MNYANKVIELTNLALTYQKEGYGTVFVNFSGHVDGLDIRIYKGRWKGEDTDIFEKVMVYLDGDNYNERRYLRIVIWLQNCLLEKTVASTEPIYKDDDYILMRYLSKTNN